MSATARAKRVLLVQDEPVIDHACLKVLSQKYALDIAAHGSLAKYMLSAQDYDIIIIDPTARFMQSKELSGYIAEEKPELMKRVVFIASELNYETSELVRQSGRPLLQRPFSPDELLKVIDRVLGEAEHSRPGQGK